MDIVDHLVELVLEGRADQEEQGDSRAAGLLEDLLIEIAELDTVEDKLHAVRNAIRRLREEEEALTWLDE